MKLFKHLFAVIAVAGSLIIAVMLYKLLEDLYNSNSMTIDFGFSAREMIAGLIADSFRAILVVMLYIRFAFSQKSYGAAVLFGLITSFMSGTLWVIYQYGVRPDLGIRFIIEETVIIALQGLFSGSVLGLVYRSGQNS